MARIFITGSADGLGRKAARLLLEDGHQVVLHARNPTRARDAITALPGAEAVVTSDLSSISAVKDLADQVNHLGAFDAIIHNAGVYCPLPARKYPGRTSGNFCCQHTRTLYLTCLITRPQRLVYLSSGLHRGDDSSLEDLTWEKRSWNGSKAYADSKFQDVLLVFAVGRRWPGVLSNVLDPGWVRTKMGGSGAPDSLEEGAATQTWLATSNDPGALVTGRYFYPRRERAHHPAADDAALQDRLLKECGRLSGVEFYPANSIL
jgi:NAD(P)-dependent dehydrogenase (short-subunit alcohol dehydrogenase family)